VSVVVSSCTSRCSFTDSMNHTQTRMGKTHMQCAWTSDLNKDHHSGIRDHRFPSSFGIRCMIETLVQAAKIYDGELSRNKVKEIQSAWDSKSLGSLATSGRSRSLFSLLSLIRGKFGGNFCSATARLLWGHVLSLARY
jgi:hypothetical protein